MLRTKVGQIPALRFHNIYKNICIINLLKTLADWMNAWEKEEKIETLLDDFFFGSFIFKSKKAHRIRILKNKTNNKNKNIQQVIPAASLVLLYIFVTIAFKNS